MIYTLGLTPSWELLPAINDQISKGSSLKVKLLLGGYVIKIPCTYPGF